MCSCRGVIHKWYIFALVSTSQVFSRAEDERHLTSMHASAVVSFQVAGRTNDSAGDGTTTASVLAREMIHYGLMVSVLG